MRRVKKLLGLCVPVLAILAITALAVNVAMAQSAGSMYWYQGYGNAGPLAWEGNYWSTTNGGAAGAWVDNSDAYFQGTAGTVYTYSPENYNLYSLNFGSNYIIENNASNTTVSTLNMTTGNVTVANGVNAAIGVWGDSTADQIYLTGTNGLTLNAGGTTGGLYLDSYRTAGSPTTAQMTGLTTIDGGILGFEGSTSNDLPGSSFVVNNGGTLMLTYGSTGKYNAPITVNGTGANGHGALQVNKDPNGSSAGPDCWNGAITLGSDSLISGYTGTLYIQSTSTAGTTTGTIALAGNNLTLSSGSNTGGVILGYAASSGTYSSNNLNVISGTGSVTYALYTGSILNPNGYNGPSHFTLPAGGTSSQVKINNANAFGTGTVTVDSGVSLLFQRLDQGTNGGTVTNAFVINGNGYIAADGALACFSNNTVLSGLITLGSNARMTGNANVFTINGNVDTTGSAYVLTLGGASTTNVYGTIMGAGGLIKADAGTTTLFGTQSYGGTTTVNGGSLVAATPASLPNYTSPNKIYVNAGAIGVRLGLIGSVPGTGWLQADLAPLITNTTWGTGSSLGLDVTNASTSFANLTGTPYGVTVTCANTSGTNTLTLTGTNSYTGPTNVNSGILAFNAASAYPINSTTVNVAGGTIQLDPGAGNTMTISNTTPITVTSSTDAPLRSLNAYSGTTTVGNVTCNGSTPIITVGAGSDPNAALIISGTLNLSNTNGNLLNIWPEGAGNTCTVTGTISGTISSYITTTVVLKTTGPGKVYLTHANTYNGETEITSTSTLNIQDPGALGASGSANGIATVDSGGNLQLQFAGGGTVTNKYLTINGTGISNSGALENVLGNNYWTGPITLATASRINSDSGTLNITGTIASGSTALTMGGAGNITLNTVLAGARTLTKDGNGTLTLNGVSNNTYTGLTTVSAGVLNIQQAQALGTTAAGTTVSGGGTLQIQGGITTIAEALTINGGGNNSTNGALESVSGANTYAGLITLGSSARINNDDAVNTFTINAVGTITGTGDLTVGGAGNTTISSVVGNTGAFVKDGAGMVTLNGVNSYTGLTTVSAGTLAYGTNNVVPNAVSVGGGTLALGGYNGTVTGVTLLSGAITGTGGTLTSTGPIAVQSGTISANLAGSVGLTKSTSGTVVLSGGLAYTGQTVIQAGTLEAVGAGGESLLTANGLDIQHGQAVWDYTGIVDSATVDSIANAEMQAAHANGWVIDPTHPVGSTTAAANPLVDALGWSDTVVGGRNLLTVMYTLCGDADLNGTVTGADLNVVLSNYNQTGMTWSQGDFNYDGVVNGADLNAVLSNYNQSVSVGAAVPEPSTLLLTIAGLAALLAYGWRKRK